MKPEIVIVDNVYEGTQNRKITQHAQLYETQYLHI